ncbi:hypothetical protein M3Y95_01023600 [Aphelenchoides besseyi]|nr:hypothetical protein M3Y95_01023600 [Aphelenchoides besseyi]
MLFTIIIAQGFYDLEFNEYMIQVNIGTPTDIIYSSVSLTTDFIFIINANCGELSTLHCPRLCYDPILSELYCTAECYKLEKVEWCSKPIYQYDDRYASTNSSTFSLTTELWRGNLENHLGQVGQWARETISFSESLEMNDWRFVNGMIMDSQIILNSQGIVGLAPGESNFVHLLFKEGRIPKAVVSLFNGYLRIGDYNEQDCSDWFHKKAVGTSWLLKVDSVEFRNQTWNSNVYLTFDLTQESTYIPDDQFVELLESGLIVRHVHVDYYHVDCNLNLDLEFTINGRKLFIPTSYFVVRPFPLDDICFLSILPLSRWFPGQRLYVDEVSWVLTRQFLNHLCVGYNYETNEIGFAEFIGPID